MKKLGLIAAALALAGCTHTATYQSPGQTYRADGERDLWTINGTMNRAVTESFPANKATTKLTVLFNDEPAAVGFLDYGMNGTITGDYNGNRVESECTGRKVSANWYDVRCIVFYNNERAATLTF